VFKVIAVAEVEGLGEGIPQLLGPRDEHLALLDGLLRVSERLEHIFSLHSCTATFVQDRGTRIRPRLPPAYRRLLEQRALRSPGRFRRLDADGMLHVEITEPLMELRRGLRRPR